MKRWLLLLPTLAIVAAIVRGQIGPGDGGATLRLPGADAPKVQTPTNTTPFLPPAAANTRFALPPSNQTGVNKDIEITDKQGPWVIYAMSYTGPEAPKLAREFALELRSNPKLKLNAYVYNYGTAEKLKAYQKVQELRQKQADALRQAGVQGQIMSLPIRIEKIEESTGVLIDGNFKTREAALAVLKELRKVKLDEDFEKRVKLDVKMVLVEQQDKAAKGGASLARTEAMFINPFRTAFPARNPALPNEADKAPAFDPEEVKLMRKLNDKEKYSLFQVKKAFTLVIKTFNTQQVVVKNQQEADGFLDRFRKGKTLKDGQWEDTAGVYAHNLCEGFRNSGLAETYVLHAKYSSFVTVGSYDSVEDPRMTQMQDLLESRFRMEAYRPYELLVRPMPMPVPQ